jgi:hypothetical protein
MAAAAAAAKKQDGKCVQHTHLENQQDSVVCTKPYHAHSCSKQQSMTAAQAAGDGIHVWHNLPGAAAAAVASATHKPISCAQQLGITTAETKK